MTLRPNFLIAYQSIHWAVFFSGCCKNNAPLFYHGNELHIVSHDK